MALTLLETAALVVGELLTAREKEERKEGEKKKRSRCQFKLSSGTTKKEDTYVVGAVELEELAGEEAPEEAGEVGVVLAEPAEVEPELAVEEAPPAVEEGADKVTPT